MQWLLDIPLPVRLAVVFAASAVVASLLNAVIYECAYNRRRFSAWQAPVPGIGPRSALDRVPILGWWRLRRDAPVLGRGFWVRPLLLEAIFPLGIAALYCWEIDRQGLIDPLLPVATPVDWGALSGVMHAQFFAHAILAAFMWAATFIDLDEKTIPDAITWPGTLIGLVLMTACPLAALPDVTEHAAPPVVGQALAQPGGAPVVGLGGGLLYVTPVHPLAPNDWPSWVTAPRGAAALWVGLACLWFWGFAVSDRYWPPKRLAYRNRLADKLGVWSARFRRDLFSFPLRNILVAGTLAIAVVWFTGGAAWLGLWSGLVGLVLGCLLVWAVRVVGSAAVGREAMGFGDVTLMMMLGVFLGWQACLVVFFFSPFAGLAPGIASLILGRGGAIPYGPFLCLAAVVVVVRWGDIWSRAQMLFGPGWLVPVVLTACIALLGILLVLIQLAKRPFQSRRHPL